MRSALSTLVGRLRANQPLSTADVTVFDDLRRRSKEKSIATLLSRYAIEVNTCETLRHKLYLIRSEAQTYSGDVTGGLASLLMALRLRPFEHVNINGLSALWQCGVTDAQLASFFTLGRTAVFSSPVERIEPISNEGASSSSTVPRILGDAPRALTNLGHEIDAEHLRGAVSVCGPCHLIVADGFVGTVDSAGIVPNCSTRHGYILGDQIVRRHFDRLAQSDPIAAGRAAFIGDAFGSANYAHWLLDWLPRLELIRLCNLKPDAIIYARSAVAFQDASLRWVLRGDELRIDTSKHHVFQCQELYLADSCFHSHMHPAHRASSWSLKFFETLGRKITPDTDKQHRRIHVSRQRSRRRISNYEEVSSLLNAYGFEELFLEELSFEDQVTAFTRAAAVFGLHGAGLANLVFCRPATSVMEVFGRFGGNGFALLACRKGLAYSAMGTSESPAKSDTSMASEHVLVDVALLDLWLRGLPG